YFQADVIREATHGGTHMDAPLHFSQGGWDVSQIPLERMMFVPVALIDIERQSDRNSSYKLAVSDIENWERRHGRLPDGGVLLVRTGWSKVSALYCSMYNLENLADMRCIPATGGHVNAMPMKIPGASGAPVRVVVVLP
ncbi:unnamed protein product, partial [Ixodes hexagonus]